MGLTVADGAKTIERLAEQFPGAIESQGNFAGQHWAVIAKDRLIDICTWLRDEASYDFLTDVTAVHWPSDDRPFEVVYHLYSYEHDDRVRLKVRLAEGESIPTVCRLWKTADWNERETYDMFGIRFDGHPDLRRILMPDDYTDFPLRKEFPLYRG